MDTAAGVYFRQQDYAGVCAFASIPVWHVGSKDMLIAMWAAVYDIFGYNFLFREIES
jgi:hypothetical protein